MDDFRNYFIYTLKINGREKWHFGTTENIKIKDFTVEKKQIRGDIK